MEHRRRIAHRVLVDTAGSVANVVFALQSVQR